MCDEGAHARSKTAAVQVYVPKSWLGCERSMHENGQRLTRISISLAPLEAGSVKRAPRFDKSVFTETFEANSIMQFTYSNEPPTAEITKVQMIVNIFKHARCYFWCFV